ncbi:vascular cell adhesion protein 1-like isoform X2 [Sphaeramia orbicularis]|uniref:vascular cell adhesion protein 1-like isoform X2 n=1 Tax=Sphaeramia orbicularis TaxID=375764 RepID=UPI00117D425A|nr:vascular cell adhesion protein 1-like isoform X2 [Sphaeramia orbicularis]
MFFLRILLGICILYHFHDLHVSSCEDICEDPPVFSPSHLVVRHGDPTSATCTVCKEQCHNKLIGLEKSLGSESTKGTTITWKVEKLTEWDTSALCFYNYNNSKQCCTELPVTVYHPPVRVSLRFMNGSGPLIVNHTYTLQCTVEDVAPVNSLIVSFYKGDTQLAQSKFHSEDKKPMTKAATHDINPSREDNGAQYWCEARLELGPEGPEHPPVVESENITSTVHYMPYQDRSSHSDPVIVTNGYPFHLNCSAKGNPSPTYDWTFPSSVSHVSNSSNFTVNSATFAHGGQYICTVFNDLGVLHVEFNVQVQVDYIPIIIGVVVAVIVLIALIFIIWFIQYYKHNKTGHYKVMGVIPFRSRHCEVPLKA